MKRKEITTSVIRYDIIIMTNIFFQCRNLYSHLVHNKTGNDFSTIYVIMRIILLTFRICFHRTGSDPHMKFFTSFLTHFLFQIMSNFICINKCNAKFLCHITWAIKICAMSIYKRIPLKRIAHILFTQIIFSRSIFIIKEIPSYYAIEKNRYATFRTCLQTKTAQISIERSTWIRVAICLRLFIVMPELDKNIISRLYQIKNFLPMALINKTL